MINRAGVLTIVSVIVLCIIPYHGVCAGDTIEDFKRNINNPEYQDALVGEGSYGVLPRGYDVSGYDRIPFIREMTPFGTYPAWNHPLPEKVRAFTRQEQYSLDRPYFSRHGFVYHEELYSPDEWGQLLRDNNVLYLDYMGGDRITEALITCKKYGLNYYIYAPDYYNHPAATNNYSSPRKRKTRDPMNPISLPFFNDEFALYEEAYRKELAHWRNFYRQYAAMFEEYGGLWDENWMDDADRNYVLFVGGDGISIDQAIEAITEDWDRANAEFKAEYGFDLPMYTECDTPVKKAQRIAFWHWVRAKSARVAESRVRIFKEAFAGKGKVSTNVHFCTQFDFERYGEIFDPPGVAIRATIGKSPLVWKYYNGYGTKLVYDLSDKLPVISVRCNLVTVDPKIIPTPESIRYWYSEIVQSGCRGFYHFTNDRGHGFMYGNPDRSTLPKLRWETNLEMSRVLGETRVFVPPESEVGVLVSLDHTSIADWKRIMSAYIELKEAGIWFKFISDQELWEKSESLDQYKIVFIPVMTFEHRSVLDQIREYVRNGGTVVACDPGVYSYDEHGQNVTDRRKKIFAVSHKAVEVQGTDAVFQPDPVDIRINTYGKGKTYFCLDPVLNIYSHGNDADLARMDRRSALYRKWVKEAGADFQGWVYEVNVKNIRQLTGTMLPEKPPVINELEFRDFHINR